MKRRIQIFALLLVVALLGLAEWAWLAGAQ